jgi:phage protein D
MTEEHTLAPKYAITIGDRDLTENISKFIKRIEYESTDGMADVARLVCINPDNLLSDAKLFQPGNEMSLYFGYKEPLHHVGRVLIYKQVPFYPQTGQPTLIVTGYTKDAGMSDNEPQKSKRRVFKKTKYSDAVKEVASKYGFQTENLFGSTVDKTVGENKRFIQKSGVTDYAFIQGLANITGYVFWVDGDENGEWTLHFRNPSELRAQDKTYTFKYNQGDMSSLLEFRPELLIKGAKTKIKAVVKDKKTGRVIKVEIEEKNNRSPELDATIDPFEKVKGEYTTASDIKLFFGSYSFEETTDKRFRTESELKEWVEQWFRRQRENFILCEGKTIGLETLSARQIHNIDGVSSAYNGSYYFSKVRHTISNTEGYICDFNGRKIVP